MLPRGNTIKERRGNLKLTQKTMLAFILCLCIVIPAQIHGEFKHRADFDTGDGPHSAGLADLDGDGDLDIVTADYFGDTVSILVNDGEGIFSKEAEYRTGDGPRSLFLADVDGDNDIDIVTANYHDDSASVLKNFGNGTFASKVDYDVGQWPYSIFLADVGEDVNGDVDLITADERFDEVSVLKNDGSGAFGNKETYEIGTKPKGIFLADLNDDGYDDIATANWGDDSVSVLINNADGTFKEQVEYITGNSPRSISMADLDNNDKPDIVTANQHSDSISILLNNGDGTFGSKKDHAVGTNPINVFLGDIDGDGDSDVLTTNLLDDTITVLENDGYANFGNRTDYVADNGPYCVLLGEVNGDGKVDIVTANNYADTISIRYSNSPPSITIIEPDGVNDIANNSYTITWKDFDPEDDALITLYWDDDDQGLDGTEIVSGVSEDDDGIGGTYVWNISNMPENDYWIYARIEDGIFNPRYNYSSGALTINHSIITNTPPTFQIIEPDGYNDFADKEFTIMWMDSDPDDDALISLYHDINDYGFDGDLIIEGLGEDADGGSGFYTWNTTSIPEGGYYIYGICDDGINEAVKRYSSYPLIVNHTSPENELPFIQILEPDGEGDYADMEYMITWMDSDADDDASISLYYDSDNSGIDGDLIVSGLSENENGNSGMYIWNTSQILNGEYWVYARITDGIAEARHNYSSGPLIINHSTTSNIPPTFQITEPDGESDFADKEFAIEWIDSDPDDDASISLYYDTNGDGFDGEQIVVGLSEDDDSYSGTYTWNTTDMQEGEYFVYGICDDGNNEAVKRYSLFPVIINHTMIGQPPSTNQTPPKNNPPLIQIVEPDGENDYANNEYTITWIDSDPDDDASISLYYDSNAPGYDGILIVSGLSENEHGNSGMYIWNTALIPEGGYFVYAIIDDGFEVSRDYSPGMVTINHSGAFNTAPKILILTPETGVVKVDEKYTILWMDSDPDDNASISLYYDTDQSGHDGTLIISGLSEDDENDFFLWNTTDISNGEYYVYAKIEDGMNEAVYDYSDGKLRIDHSVDEEENGDGDEDRGAFRFLSENYLLFLILAVVLILILIVFLWRRRKEKEGEEELEELEEERVPLPDDLEEDEIDEELLSTPEDLEEEEIDEDLLPPPEDFDGEGIDEKQLPPPKDYENEEIEGKPLPPP